MLKGTIRNHLGITVSAIKLGTYVEELNNESLLTSVPDESSISEDNPVFGFLASECSFKAAFKSIPRCTQSTSYGHRYYRRSFHRCHQLNLHPVLQQHPNPSQSR